MLVELLGRSMHIPVLCNQVINVLKPTMSQTIFDTTFGRGGHTKLFLQRGLKVVACDRDLHAYYFGKNIGCGVSNLHMYRGRFTTVAYQLKTLGYKFDGILLDLGMSSEQIADEVRGFSFKCDGLIDMRMGDNDLSAFDVVNYASYDLLCSIFKSYGEEKMYKLIAKDIVKRRKSRLFYMTKDLVSIISKHVTSKQKHPATRIFQALRIFVNNELNELIQFLKFSKHLLKPSGTLAVISFHSLEDRIVKRFFMNKNKLFCNKDEKKSNKRSRSAILRWS